MIGRVLRNRKTSGGIYSILFGIAGVAQLVEQSLCKRKVWRFESSLRLLGALTDLS